MLIALRGWLSQDEAAARWITVQMGLPVAVALGLGWFHAGAVTRELPMAHSMLYWLAIWIGYWIAATGCTALVRASIPALRKRVFVTALLGGLLASAASAIYLQWYWPLFADLLVPADRLRIAAFNDLPLLDRVGRSIANSGFGIALWSTASLLARRPKISRYVLPAAPSAIPEPVLHVEPDADPVVEPLLAQPNGLAAALAPKSLADVIAVHAQDHYVMIYTESGQKLVLYRFRDAVADLAAERGEQIHRSWWISASAASAAQRIPNTDKLKVSADLVVPMGRHFRAGLKRLQDGYNQKAKPRTASNCRNIVLDARMAHTPPPLDAQKIAESVSRNVA